MPHTPTTWKAGQSGNPNGRPRGRHAIAEALRTELSQIETTDADGNPLTRAQVIARMAVNMAMSGDLKAIEFVTERLEGKPRQALQIRRTSPSAEELRARLASLVEANPALPDQLASLGRRQVTATVLPAAPDRR